MMWESAYGITKYSFFLIYNLFPQIWFWLSCSTSLSLFSSKYHTTKSLVLSYSFPVFSFSTQYIFCFQSNTLMSIYTNQFSSKYCISYIELLLQVLQDFFYTTSYFSAHHHVQETIDSSMIKRNLSQQGVDISVSWMELKFVLKIYLEQQYFSKTKDIITHLLWFNCGGQQQHLLGSVQVIVNFTWGHHILFPFQMIFMNLESTT